jgi:thiol-disulfide isomerase/thioredoxin
MSVIPLPFEACARPECTGPEQDTKEPPAGFAAATGVVFVNVWATWCAPCGKGMPHLKELYDRVRDRTDAVLVTFNVDEKPELVAPFITRTGYTFPVLMAHDLVRNELAVRGIPRNWVLDASGVWRADRIGLPMLFGRSWVGWAEGLIAKGKRPA